MRVDCPGEGWGEAGRLRWCWNGKWKTKYGIGNREY